MENVFYSCIPLVKKYGFVKTFLIQCIHLHATFPYRGKKGAKLTVPNFISMSRGALEKRKIYCTIDSS